MDVVELVPQERRGHGWPSAGPGHDHAPNTVLWGAFWLKSMKTRAPRSSFHHAAVTRSPRRRSSSRASATAAAAHLVRVPAALQAHVHVDAAVAGGLREARRCPARPGTLWSRGRPPGSSRSVTPGDGSRSMRSSSAWSMSSQCVGQTWKPRQPRLTAQTTWAMSASDQGVGGGAVGGGDHRRLQPGRRAGRHPLLEERLAGRAVREALHERRAPSGHVHEGLLDRHGSSGPGRAWCPTGP